MHTLDVPLYNASVNWDTVATAAATAVFVTLAVEYLAKPRLEARKERILAMMHARRDLLAGILNLALAASLILEDVPRDVDPEIRRRFQAERKRQYERMRDQVTALHDDAGRYGRLYGGPARTLVFRYLACIKGLTLSPRTQHRQAEIIKELSLPIVLVLDGPLWKPVARVRATFDLDRIIKSTEARPPDEPAPSGPMGDRRPQ